MVAAMREDDAASRLDGLSGHDVHVGIQSSSAGSTMGLSEGRWFGDVSSNPSEARDFAASSRSQSY
jgi:hypothetical protein